jgi:hypothetical protein
MKVFLIAYNLMLILPQCLPAQGDTGGIDAHYQRYRVVFERETDSANMLTTDFASSLPQCRSELPCWITGPFALTHASGEVIGISDPWTDSTKARQQAITRAIYLGSLMAGTQINSLVDHYAQEYGESGLAGQYIDYFEYICQAVAGFREINVTREARLESGEYAVLITLPLKPQEENLLHFRTTGMVTEFENKGRYETNARMEFKAYAGGPGTAPVTAFISRTIDELTEIESVVDGKTVPVILSRYRYQVPGDCHSSGEPEGARTDRGLWNALFDSLLRELATAVRSQPSRVMSTSDLYTGKTQFLNREVMTGTMTFRIAGIHVYDNRLRAILDQFNVNQP